MHRHFRTNSAGLQSQVCQHRFTHPDYWPANLIEEFGELEDLEYLNMLPSKTKTS